MPQIGDTVLHYEILSELGAGGMGQVFRARDTRLDRDVALKFLHNQHQLDQQQRERLLIEAKAAARLDHPNIANLYTIEKYEGESFLVMALYEGEGLDEKLKRGPLPLESALALFKQLLEGLAHAHERDVIHRDIKPANVFVTNKGVVKILDFGLARLPESNLTQHGQFMGSPSYMSPEQIKQEGVDHRADIWSLGVLLFHLLTGYLPFEGKFPQVMVSILKEEPKSISAFFDHKGLQVLIERCLAKDKFERFESCDALAKTLTRLESNEHLTLITRKTVVAPSSKGLDSFNRRLSASLIGREQEQSDLHDLVTDENNYLITITGMGGAGKTSLARVLMANPSLDTYFPDGKFFVPLDALRDATQIPFEIAQVMNLQLKGQYLWAELRQSLQSKTCLLVMDNLEHLIEACAAQLEDLMLSCPNVSILATSREVLKLEGEVVYDLRGLSVPESVNADFDAFGATQLFITRAKRLKRSFNPNDHREDILAICQQLEGWPLGIELAVAWIRQLTASEIAERLKETFDFLTSRARSQASRHLSARSAFEHSYELLSPGEQTALAKLSVFQGGFSTFEAEEICMVKLPTLASLVDKSLLSITEEGRYDKHPLINEFSQEKLALSEDSRKVHEQHTAYYQTLASTAEPLLRGSEQIAWFQRLDLELDNLLAAVSYLEQSKRYEQGLKLVITLGHYWLVRGQYQLALSLLQRFDETFLVKEREQKQLHARGLVLKAQLQHGIGQFTEAKVLFEKSSEIFRELGDKKGLIDSLNFLGRFWRMAGDIDQATRVFQEGLTLSRELQYQHGIADAFIGLGFNARYQGHYSEANRLFQHSLQFYRNAQDQRGIASTLSHLCGVSGEQEQYEQARTYSEEALMLYKELGDQLGTGLALHDLSIIANQQGLVSEAETYFKEIITLYERLGAKPRIIWLRNDFGVSAMQKGDYQQAENHFKAGFALAEEVNSPLWKVWFCRQLALIAKQRRDTTEAHMYLQAARQHFLESLELFQTQEDQPETIRALSFIAEFLSTQDNHEASIRLFAATKTQFSRIGRRFGRDTQNERQEILDQQRNNLGEERFNEYWEDGLELSIGDALKLARSQLNRN